MSGFAQAGNLSPPRRAVAMAGALAAFGVYIVFATLISLFYPLALPVFLAPAGVIALAFAPEARAVPRRVVFPLVLAAAALMPVWPTYIHLAVGSLPLLTPPRVIFYALTLIWIYDMSVSRWRRGQFLVALKRRPWLAGAVLGFFALNALSVPMAEGRVLAAQAFIRQAIILLVPFCIFATYVRRWRDLRSILLAITLGAGLAGAIAMGEAATRTLLAAKLSPFIMSKSQWLSIAQEIKSRDGVFRAQATHTHPISLGEYLSFCACLAGAFLMQAKARAKAFWFVVLALIVGGVVATNSRGALLALAVGGGVMAVAIAIRIMCNPRRAKFRPLVGLASVFMIASAPVVLIGAHHIITGAAGASAARSSQGRIDQIKTAWPKVKKRPVLGYGSGRAARIVGYYGRALSLDNYYLSLAVDLGIPGPLSFLLILIVSMRVAGDTGKTGPPDARWIMAGLIAALAAFLVSRMIISQTGNLNTMFPLFGALVGVGASARRSKHNIEL